MTGFMLAHLDEPLSTVAIARATSLSVRTLHRLVRRELGASPMALLRRARLLRARAELESPAPATTVTSAALRCGMTHLGRFSRDYARQFGESPSSTLRRARRREDLTAARPCPEVAGAWHAEDGWTPVVGAA